MKDWNIIVTIYQESFRRALRALEDIGPAERGPYHNVLVMKVDDPMAVLEAIERLTGERPALYDAIARVAPAMRAFERAGFLVTDIEILRLHYADTLKAWRERFLARRDEVAHLYDDAGDEQDVSLVVAVLGHRRFSVRGRWQLRS